MSLLAPRTADAQSRSIVYRTRGHNHGPVTRLFSPGDLGEMLKPFVFLDLINMESSTGSALFGYHPHSGIATITTVFQGDTAYADSTGAEGILKARGVEWMQAGGGVWHTANPAEPGRVRGFQLWLALPAHLENSPAESEYLAPDLVPVVGGVRVILGQYEDAVSPLPQIAPITYLHVKLKQGEQWTFSPAPGQNVAWVAVSDGSLEAAGVSLSREVAVFAEGDAAIRFRAQSDVEFMLGAAAKHPHPLVTGYYSVHTSTDALRIGEAGIRTIAAKLRAEGTI